MKDVLWGYINAVTDKIRYILEDMARSHTCLFHVERNGSKLSVFLEEGKIEEMNGLFSKRLNLGMKYYSDFYFGDLKPEELAWIKYHVANYLRRRIAPVYETLPLDAIVHIDIDDDCMIDISVQAPIYAKPMVFRSEDEKENL